MTEESRPFMEFIRDYWVLIGALFGWGASYLDVKFKVKSHGKRLDKHEEKIEKVVDENKEDRRHLESKMDANHREVVALIMELKK